MAQDENLYSSSRVTRSKTTHNDEISKPKRAVLGDRSNTLGASLPVSSKYGAVKQASLAGKAKLNVIREAARLHVIPARHPDIPIRKDIIEIEEPLNVDLDEEEMESESRRLSLKRTATDSATNLIEKSNHQETKKPKVEYVWEDLDEEDLEDPLMVSEYVVEIFQYLNKLELDTLPDKNYFTWQKNLKPRMRSILVDWIVEVHMRFRLLPETLFLAINLMDRFMSKEIVQVDKLQLLATGSLFIAAKYEEVYSPSIKNYAYVTDGGFTEDDILGAERFILEVLQFNLSYPNPMNFLRRISKADDYDIQSRTIGKYLLEISIIDYRFIGLLPSLCSALAMYVLRKMLGRFEWNGNLIHYSGGYTEEDMKQCCEMLIEYLVSPIVHEEFFKKYASKKFFKVSILLRQWAKKINNEGKNIMDAVL